MDKVKTWPMHLEFIAIIIAITSGLFMFVGRMDRLDLKMDEQIRRLDLKMDEQSRRTDTLYQMYSDQRKESDQKFYDLLKEMKK